jgi:hypothetical protein
LYPDVAGNCIIKSIKDFFSNKENVEWLTRNAGQAGGNVSNKLIFVFKAISN